MIIFKCDKCEKEIPPKIVGYAYIPALKGDADRCLDGQDVRKYMLCPECTEKLRAYLDMETSYELYR